MSSDREQVLREMGLGPVWKLRVEAVAAPGEERVAATPAAPELVPDGVAWSAPAIVTATSPLSMPWEELAATVAACRQCRLCEARKQAVLGVGDVNADWLFVGEGPGAEEDERGEPFVGQAGKLLDSMLAAIGLKRGEDVYIANAVKCRPPENRKPADEEVAACRPYLEQQMELIRPKLIVALGATAAQTLLQREIRIGAERGKLHDWRGVPLIVTYHPSYLLRTLQDKAKAWEDLCYMRAAMQALRSA
ncbi:MAG: uracil-DNA glycosylase [Sulfuritalea sp.]|nr:uracil-DNA glycosylase [Sulfuritalea sp.]